MGGSLIGGASALTAGASLIGGGVNAGASSAAAQQELAAAQQAGQANLNAFGSTQQSLQPYSNVGTNNLSGLSTAANDASNPTNPYLTEANQLVGLGNQTVGNANPYQQAGQGDIGTANQYNSVAGGLLNSASQVAQGASPYLSAASADFGAQQGQAAGAAATTNTLANGLTPAYLEQTPGYQFTLQQGLESTQNGAAARGLGTSGAANKAAASYATGLANDTYQNQFQDTLATAQQQNANASTYGTAGTNQLAGAGETLNQAGTFGNLGTQQGAIGNNFLSAASGENALAGTSLNQASILGGLSGQLNSEGLAYQANLAQPYNQLMGVAGLGENATAATGQLRQAAYTNYGNEITGGANASAAGTIGSANALTNGLTSGTNTLGQYALYSQLLGNSNGTSGVYTPGLQSYGAAGANDLQSLGFLPPSIND